MGFSQEIADEVLVRCRRHCCLCDIYAGTKIELHHIKQVADGGEDTLDNCIPLCLNCHAEVKAYNPRHPKGRKFTESELKGHRDKCYAKYDISSPTGVDIEDSEQSIVTWFSKHEKTKSQQIIWGFTPVEKICTLSPGTISLIAGYTDTGKSTYAQQIMLKNLSVSNTVLYFHLKESSDALLNNIIASESVTKLSNLQQLLLTEDDWKRISIALGTINFECLKLIPFSIHPPLTEQVLVAAEKSNANLIIIDDFNALGLRDNPSIEDFLYRLKGTIAKSGVAVIILSTIPQSISHMYKRPRQQDVQYDALYRMCDIVQFLYQRKDDFYENNVSKQIEVIVTKNRNTNITGTVKLVADPDIPVFYSIEESTTINDI